MTPLDYLNAIAILMAVLGAAALLEIAVEEAIR